MNAAELVREWGPLVTLLIAVSSGLVTVCGALVTWRKLRLDRARFDAERAAAFAKIDADRAAAQAQDRAAVIKLTQEVASATIRDLREDVERGHAAEDALRVRVDQLEQELADFRRKHEAMIADKDAELTNVRAELTLLRGDNRELLAMLESYRRLMKAAGIEPPPVSQRFWSVPPGHQPPELEELV